MKQPPLNLISVKGVVQVNPKRDGVRKVHENLIIVKVSDDLGRYYRELLRVRTGIVLDPPSFGSHLTLTDKRKPLDFSDPKIKQYIKAINHKPITLQYDPKDLYRVWHFFCLSFQSEEVLQICNRLALPTYKHLHLTIGRLPEKLLIPDGKLLSVTL